MLVNRVRFLLQKTANFTFSIPRIVIRLLQLKPTDAHSFIKNHNLIIKYKLLHVSGLVAIIREHRVV
jgi:hypothetical protein